MFYCVLFYYSPDYLNRKEGLSWLRCGKQWTIKPSGTDINFKCAQVFFFRVSAGSCGRMQLLRFRKLLPETLCSH